jgi:hypothetical protein
MPYFPTVALFGAVFNMAGPLHRDGRVRPGAGPDRHSGPDRLEIQVVARVGQGLKLLPGAVKNLGLAFARHSIDSMS